MAWLQNQYQKLQARSPTNRVDMQALQIMFGNKGAVEGALLQGKTVINRLFIEVSNRFFGKGAVGGGAPPR